MGVGMVSGGGWEASRVLDGCLDFTMVLDDRWVPVWSLVVAGVLI